MSIAAMKPSLEAAYLAGFNASSEGWNGEYPFQDNDKLPEQDPGWLEKRDIYVSQAIEADHDYRGCSTSSAEIIRMASEAGCDMSRGLTSPPVLKAVAFTPAQLKRFAELVVAAEREACALACEEEAKHFERCAEGANDGRYDWKADGSKDCAVVIRARG